jgi:hypothetical protein
VFEAEGEISGLWREKSGPGTRIEPEEQGLLYDLVERLAVMEAATGEEVAEDDGDVDGRHVAGGRHGIPGDTGGGRAGVCCFVMAE